MSDPEPPTPPGTIALCDIVSVLIRILAIKLGISNLSYWLSSYTKVHERYRGQVSSAGVLMELLALAFIILCAYWLWKLSSFLARLITLGRNSVLPASSFDLLDLYSFAFVFVGLNLIVDGFVPSLTQLYSAVTQGSSTGALTLEQKTSFYTLFNSLTRLIVGLGLTLNARKLATKLLKRQGRPMPAEHAAVE